jgi:hypothetical protein
MRTVWLEALPGDPDPQTRYMVKDPVDLERVREFYTAPGQTILRSANGPDIYGKLAAFHTLTSTTAWQRLLGIGTNGKAQIETGHYLFECLYRMSAMSMTSGNAGFRLAGTATLANVARMNFGHDASNTAPRNTSGLHSSGVETAFDIVESGTSALMAAFHTGSFEVTAAGTLGPEIALTTAAAALVTEGSYFACWRVASEYTVGEWS